MHRVESIEQRAEGIEQQRAEGSAGCESEASRSVADTSATLSTRIPHAAKP